MPPATSWIVADTHVHVYPDYDAPAALRALLRNLGALAGRPPAPAVRLGFLAEARGCAFFRQARATGLPGAPAGMTVAPGPDESSLQILLDGQPGGWLFAGRQIVTRERLEVLALTADVAVPDGLPAQETLAAVRADGALPVLSWSPGKWFFKRGRKVREVLAESAPDALLLGDTALRPRLWPLPLLLRFGIRRGFICLAGSDPLPLPGEERWLGAYATAGEAPFDPAQPTASARHFLTHASVRRHPAGQRCRPLPFARRWLRNARR
jgi:hypothetical protein